MPPFDETQQQRVLAAVAQRARAYRIATILGMEWLANGDRRIAAVVLDADGQLQGIQIHFVSVNYAFRHQESATTLIGPSGECAAYLPYGEEGVLVHDLDLKAATGLLASRYAPERYQDFVAGGS